MGTEVAPRSLAPLSGADIDQPIVVREVSGVVRDVEHHADPRGNYTTVIVRTDQPPYERRASYTSDTYCTVGGA